MLNLRHRFTLRISDRLAIAAALVLTLTAAGGALADRYLGEGTAAPTATAMPAEADAPDPTSDDAAAAGGLTVSLLLFGHG